MVLKMVPDVEEHCRTVLVLMLLMYLHPVVVSKLS